MPGGTEIGKIFYTLDLNDENFKKGLNTSSKASSDFGSNISSIGNKAAIALGAVGAGLTIYAKQATDFTVDYVKNAKMLARETGATTEETSKLLFVTNRLGISADQVSTTFGIFSKQIVATKNATDPATTALGKLGVSVHTANGEIKSFNTILLEVSDKFKAMPDGPIKTADAMALFGRSGKDMIKVLDLGSVAIANLETQADKLGLTLTPGNVDKVNQFIQSQKNLKDQTDALKLSVGLATTPVLTDFNTWINNILQSLLGMDGPIKTVTTDVLAFGGPVLGATGAIIGFAANVGQVISTVAELQITLASFTGFAVFAAAAGAAGGAIIGEFVLVIRTINDTVDAINNAQFAAQNLATSQQIVHSQLLQLSKTGNAGQKARAKSLLGRGFAAGGSVQGGVPITVGEKGPELFVPKTAGEIIPNNKMGKAMGNTYNFGDLNFNTGAAVDRFVHFLKTTDRNQQLESMGLSPAV